MEIHNFIILITLTTIFYSAVPLLIVLLILPNFLSRIVIKLLKLIVRNDLGDFVSSLGPLFAVDDLYEKPTATLILSSLFQGILKTDHVCQLVSEKWLNKKDLCGNLVYPELRQSVEEWLGYNFWRNDDTFCVSNHIREIFLNGSIKFGDECIRSLLVQLVNFPFVPGRSPWEIILIKSSDKLAVAAESDESITIVILRVHHCLIDGVSIINLCKDLATFDQVDNLSITLRHTHSCKKQSNLSLLKGILRIPYFAAKFLHNSHTAPLALSRQNKQVACTIYHRLDMKMMKYLKRKYNVSLTSILLAGFTAAIRRATQKSDYNNEHCVIPVPLPEHPETLGNYMSFVSVDLPLKENCSRKRLLQLHKCLDDARNSLDVLSMFYLLRIIAVLPVFIVKSFSRRMPATFLLSNFPGLKIPLRIGEIDCQEVFFNGGLLQGNTNAVCSSVGYKETIGFALTYSEIFTCPMEQEEILQVVLNEFEILKNNYE